MPFELEALVGHLYMVGGRTIKTTPPGALVEIAPGKAARGREADTFFTLVLPSGNIAPNTFYEQMGQMSAERFFATTGSITSALREVLNTLNNNLFEHNQSGRTHYEASMVCAVLRDDELYLGRVGAAIAVLRHDAGTLTYPEDLTVDEALYQPPLGVQPIPTVHMKRFVVDSGTRLILADAALAEIKLDNLTHALVSSDLEQVLNEMKLIITGQIQMMAVEFVPADAPVTVAAITGESTAAINAQLASSRLQAATAEMPGVTPRSSRRNNVSNNTRRATGSVVQTAGKSLVALGEVAGKLFARPIDSNRARFSPGFLMGTVIAIPALIVLVVVLLWVFNVGGTEFETCVNNANNVANTARGLDSSNPGSVMAGWEAVIESVDFCLQMRPDDPGLLALRTEGRGVLDSINNITRRGTVLLATFPEARLKTLVLQGLNLYALDDANDLVYRVQIGADGISAAGLPQPIVNMRRGATVDGLTIGDIIDIDYDTQEDRIAALDRGGVLVRCLPQFLNQCEGQRVLATETFQNPVKIDIWQGRLFVLDPQGNQLWRYQPTGGQYPGNPTEYFSGDVRPNLINAVDFDITTTGIGAVYTLYSDGLMTRHLSGEPQNFGIADLGENETLAPSQSMYLNDGPIDASIYVVKQSTRMVYKMTQGGTISGRYQVFNEDDFALLTDIVVDSSSQILYAASGNAIFALKLGE